MAVDFQLNGQPRSIDPAPGESLLDALRERCGMRSLKDGCQPQGQCGCCLALVDGRPLTTCAFPAHKIQGRAVVTLEGLSAPDRQRIADAFVHAAGLQCGFCIPGIALRAHHLLQRPEPPTRAHIARALDVHLCRCTGYVKIIDAIEQAALHSAPPPAEKDGVGASHPRWEGHDTVLGAREYVDDMVRPGMLHGALVFSAHARARVHRIDVSRAEAVEGVHAVLTARDVPGDRWYGLIYADWPGFVAEGEEVRCVGDVLAAVAAVDRRTAREAAALVEVEYEPLPAVLDPEAALHPDAPQVNPRHPNVLSRTRIQHGDADHALASSVHRIKGTWRTQRIEHLYLEPESVVAEPRDNGAIHLWTQGQGIFDDRRQVASFLNLPESQVTVELVPNGGAFGGKEDMSVQAHTSLLALRTHRPVKLTLTREESIRLHPKRHPMIMHYEAGCDADGFLTAIKARILGDSGAYASVGGKVLERAAGHACGPYVVPIVDVEAVAVYTNNPPSGAMRGFGVNQTAFAVEGCVEELAGMTGIDPWEFRYKNAVDLGDAVTTGQVLTKSVGLKRTLQAVKPAYDAARAEGKKVGLACGLKNSGIGNGVVEHGKARIVRNPDGTFDLHTGYTEMGQGLFTVLKQLAAEASGLPAEAFVPRTDTRFEVGCGQTTGSRGTLLAGRAVIDAARKMKDDPGKSHYEGEVVISDTTPPEARNNKTHTTYGFATQLCVLDAQGRIERIVAAHDVGRAVNPALCEGQIEGSIHMGLGYALTEDLPLDHGRPTTSSLRDLGVLRARDVPAVEVILVEEHEPEGPYGAKGVGEIGLVPTAPAVAAALKAFDGITRTELPMRGTPAARALSVGR